MNRRSLASLSILLWPVVLLLLVAVWQPSVPVHYDWDAFSYLTAAKSRENFVVLGLGRTPFCLLGQWLDPWSLRIHRDDPFGLFRLWMWSGVVLQALAVAVAGIVAVRRLGLPAAHLGAAIYVTHSRQLVLTLSVWPETWAIAFGLLAFASLAAPRISWWARLCGSAFFCLLMIMMKEVFVAFMPALMLLVWGLAPRSYRWTGRTLLATGYALITAVIPLLVVVWVLPRVMPGLAEARAELLRGYGGQSNVGLQFFFDNLWDALYWGAGFNAVLVLLCAASLLRLAVKMLSAPRRGAWLLRSGWVLALIAAPLVTIAATGQVGMMNRYAQMLVPGVALLAGLWAVHPVPAVLASPQHGPMVFATALTSVLWFHQWTHTTHYAQLARADAARYRIWREHLDERLGLYVADDTRAAHYLYTFSPPHAKTGGEWVIRWPYWEPGRQGPPPPEWLDEQAAAGRAVVVSHTTEQRTGSPASELLPGWNIRPIGGAWYIAHPKDDKDSKDN